MSLALGDRLEAAAIGVVLVINTVIGFTTELRARRAMEALLELEVPRATVVRDGQLRVIDAHTLVPGDVIEIGAGQAVPADARLVSTTDLRLTEAALTGESLPIVEARRCHRLPAIRRWPIASTWSTRARPWRREPAARW